VQGTVDVPNRYSRQVAEAVSGAETRGGRVVSELFDDFGDFMDAAGAVVMLTFAAIILSPLLVVVVPPFLIMRLIKRIKRKRQEKRDVWVE